MPHKPIVSVCMPYCNRLDQLIYTLFTIDCQPSRENIEVVIVDDNSDTDIFNIVDLFPSLRIIVKKQYRDKGPRCPVLPHNESIALSSGDYVIIQNSECCWDDDIASHVIMASTNDNYLIYNCYALSKDDTLRYRKGEVISHNPSMTVSYNGVLMGGWYQHPLYRNENLNFCVALTRKSILSLGGFDERYKDGIDHADNDFLKRVRLLGLDIVNVESPMVYHQYHEPFSSHGMLPINANLFHSTITEKIVRVKNSYL